jgi:phosphoribosylanthranilate isomerase
MEAVRVKICGITTQGDARAAVRAGADALGFLVGLLYPSEDQLSAEQAAEIIARLPPFVSPTLVTHRSRLAEVVELCRVARPHVLQLHGDFHLPEIPLLRRELPHLKVIKAVHVDGPAAVERAVAAAEHADAVLLDTRTATRIGGTGVTHDWGISRQVRDALGERPVILAGGLDPENVSAAIERVLPWAVDVNSGVCVRRGQKSVERMESFVRNAKSAFSPASA